VQFGLLVALAARGLTFYVLTRRMLDTKKLTPIGKFLIAKKETVAIAESVTSGLLMANLSLAKNATLFFQGGITAYNLGQKTRQLDIEPIHAESANCVSDHIAEEMAIHVANKFRSQWGIGITGYAVPVPELKIDTCFAFYSFSYRGEIVVTTRVESTRKGQAKVQLHFVETVLRSFESILKSRKK
jgi:nicotinamide-nucleotide amidase